MGRRPRNRLLFPLLIAAIVLAASAASVSVLKSTEADYAGAYFKPYYENTNAPVTGCTSPCLAVDTQSSETNPSSGTLSLDGSATGTWSSGSSFTISATTANSNDVVVVWTVAYKSGSSITVSSVSDSLAEISWQSSARSTLVSCTGTDEVTETEWYGVATRPVSSDTITVTLTGAPTLASGEEFAVTGADTASPFDTNANVPQSATACVAGTSAPTASGLSTSNSNDFIFALYGGYTSTTETAGNIAGAASTLMKTVAGTGDSLAAEYKVVAATESSQSCAFGKATTYWGILCDAIVQASGSFSLPAGSTMYLWSPQFATATAVPASSLSFQLFADLPSPALDGDAVGTWSSGTTLASASFSTTHANDVVMLSIVTYASGSSVTVSSITDSQSGIAWHGSARSSFTSCSGAQETTHVEWYGIASAAVTSDIITVHLASTPTAASVIAFGVSGADTVTPFDPDSVLPATAESGCTATGAAPTVSSVSTVADDDFVFALFGAETSVTETAGKIGGSTSTLITTQNGAGRSNAAEYLAIGSALSAASCAFGTSTTYWGILCDALVPARESITVSYYTTNSAGTVQSTMTSGATATITALYAGVSVTSSAGAVPASGYIEVQITAPAAAALTVYWGYPKPTDFQVTYTYRG